MVSGMGLRWASLKVVKDGIPMGAFMDREKGLAVVFTWQSFVAV